MKIYISAESAEKCGIPHFDSLNYYNTKNYKYEDRCGTVFRTHTHLKEKENSYYG